MEAIATLDHRKLYRVPWNLSDNPIGWVEITNKCNLACDGCYRKNTQHHKSLAEIEADLDVFASCRTINGIRLAGGEPLIHPGIVDIVRLITKRGWKPFIISNGLSLTQTLLQDLGKAGLKDIMFHVDSRQNRPGWKNKDEIALCELRQQLAERVAQVGGITCSFNSTVYGDTLHQIGEIVSWAHRNIDIVNGVVFICYRTAPSDRFDFYAQGKKLPPEALPYQAPQKERIDITSREIVARIRERFPDFAPSGYLNGTESPDSLKWLLANRIGTKQRIFGHLGAKGLELLTILYHWRKGSYLIHPPRGTLAQGRGMLWALSWFDPEIRRGLWRWLKSPASWLRRLHVQAVSVVQPLDVAPDGRQSMCDGCPDVTPFKGRLACSCRLEECLSYGRFMDMIPKEEPASETVKLGLKDSSPAIALKT